MFVGTRFGSGSRKRDRNEGDDFGDWDERVEGEEEPSRDDEGVVQGEGEGEVESVNTSDVVSPGDSASQITPVEESESELEGEEDEAGYNTNVKEGRDRVQDESLDELAWHAEEETTAQRKVQEYLARQAELMSRQEEFKKHIAGGQWHSDELYLFDRLSMRSFEPIFPLIWQLDLPTLNPALFSKGKTFFNSNYAGRDYGESI